MRRPAAWFLSLAFVLSVGAAAHRENQDKEVGGSTRADAAVYFIDLKDRAAIAPRRRSIFGLRGMGVAPACSGKADSGHFSAGQTETVVKLVPEMHTLQLLLGDKNHVPHSPPVMSERIRVTGFGPGQHGSRASAASFPLKDDQCRRQA